MRDNKEDAEKKSFNLRKLKLEKNLSYLFNDENLFKQLKYNFYKNKTENGVSSTKNLIQNLISDSDMNDLANERLKKIIKTGFSRKLASKAQDTHTFDGLYREFNNFVDTVRSVRDNIVKNNYKNYENQKKEHIKKLHAMLSASNLYNLDLESN